MSTLIYVLLVLLTHWQVKKNNALSQTHAHILHASLLSFARNQSIAEAKGLLSLRTSLCNSFPRLQGEPVRPNSTTHLTSYTCKISYKYNFYESNELSMTGYCYCNRPLIVIIFETSQQFTKDYIIENASVIVIIRLIISLLV